MTDFSFSDGAAWIWSGEAAPAANTFMAFRREIAIEGDPKAAALHLTADSRYALFVNGAYVGFGPPRSWPSPWPVDAYDLGPLLRAGRNVIAVLVQHFGIGTFQYLPADPGLLAQVAWTDEAGEHRVVTDAAWRCRRHEGFHQVVPRISVQQGWEEQFDARRSPGPDWAEAACDGADWPNAVIQAPAGAAPHTRFERRDIPMLTRESVSPRCVSRADVVKAAPYTWSLNLRFLLNAEDTSANPLIGNMLLATHIHSDREQPIGLQAPHGGEYLWKLNGDALAFTDKTLQPTDSGVAHGTLRAGENTLLVRMPLTAFFWTLVVNVWAEADVQFRARPTGREESPWLALGPFGGAADPRDSGFQWQQVWIQADTVLPDATRGRFDTLWERGALLPEDFSAAWARPVPSGMISAADIFALCASERIVGGAAALIDNVQALAEDTAEWATVHPSPDGDVRVLLDFGREVVGFHAFEIDAPAGTTVDIHDFEFIQYDGRVNLCEGMNNSLRYVCRAGSQRFRSFVRRGLRYSWVTFRSVSGPFKVRAVRVEMCTYPTAGRGEFVCSDPMLSAIWQAGAHSVRCCSEDTYTDCPTYEQVFWVGDARNEALVDLVANGDPRLSRHCWIQAGRSLDRSPIVESQVPSSWTNILPAWSFLWMRWAQEHYLLTGDTDFGREALGFLERNIAGITQHINDRGLFQYNAWNMFDWAPADTPADGTVTHLHCLAVMGLRQSADLAARLGDEDRARAWNGVADRLTEAVNRSLWSDERQAYVDCLRRDGTVSPVFSQQTQTAAFISGVASRERGRRCRQIIEEAPEGFITAGSPFYMFFVLEVLVRDGRYDLLQKTIRDYWGVQIEAGATTFWEMYDPNAERHTRSHCHGWSAAPTYFLTQHVLGVQPLEPGYKSVLVRPQPSGLRWCHGRVPTPQGLVGCDWRRGEGAFTITVETPPGIPARIELPEPGTVTVLAGQAQPAPGDVTGRNWLSDGGRVRLSTAVPQSEGEPNP